MKLETRAAVPKTMTNLARTLALPATLAGALQATAANAQPALLYPYAVQQDQLYAVQVAHAGERS